MKRVEGIHFGTIGLKIGDRIRFRNDNIYFIVSSGEGTPNNGGTLVRGQNWTRNELWSLRLATRRLLGAKFHDGIDAWSYWSYKGKTLREIYESKRSGIKS